MTTTMSPFLTALGSEGPPADRVKEMELYGWLVGSWETDSIHYLDDGTVQNWIGEIHFGWVQEPMREAARMSAIHAEVSQRRPMIWPSSRFEAPSASRDRTNRSSETVGSPASILATRDWLDCTALAN